MIAIPMMQSSFHDRVRLSEPLLDRAELVLHGADPLVLAFFSLQAKQLVHPLNV